MRRKISIIGVLLLALCVSGWSSALAAAISCPHAKGEAPGAMVEQDHSCCRAKTAEAEAHCSTSGHEAMAESRVMPVIDAGAVKEAVAQPAESCAHCMDRPEVPATLTFCQANQIKRSADAATARTAMPTAPFMVLFAPRVLSRQGSPPGTQARKHLLISVFII